MSRTREVGTLAGPTIIGNEPGDGCGYRLPDGSRGTINSGRVAFVYFLEKNGVRVYTDLDSDCGISRRWKGKPEKALCKAMRVLAGYGDLVGLDDLLADGWWD